MIDKESGKAGIATINNDLGYTDEQLIRWTYDVTNNDGIIFRSYDPTALVEQLTRVRGQMNEENDAAKIIDIDNLISSIDQEGNNVVMYGYLRSDD